MSSNVSAFTKKALKVTGAAAAATGVVALSALVASGAAVGAVVEGFKAAGNTFKDVMKKEENKAEVAEATEDVQAEAVQVVEAKVQEEAAETQRVEAVEVAVGTQDEPTETAGTSEKA